MIFKNITILDENFEIQENMNVQIKGDRILRISNEMIVSDCEEEYDGHGKLLMPGFFNIHAHSPMTLMRGYAENYNLQDWLSKKIFPFEAHLDPNAVYWGTMLAMAESLRFGIVSSTDMYYFLEDMIRAVSDAKCKDNISFAVTQFDESNPKELSGYKETVDIFNKFNNSYSEKIKIDCSLHAEYTSKPWTVEAVSDFAREVNANMHIHISETAKEHNECLARYGMTPVAYFNKYGALDTRATLAHCVHIDDNDIEILKSKDVTVASNPISNLKLASGVCNVPKLLKNGISVGIRTDSVASNNSLNFIEEIKVFSMVSKMMYNDPTAVTPKEALYSATRVGALSQGRIDSGLLKEGYKADLIVIDIDKPNMMPTYDLRNNIVFSSSGSDVVMTMVDGEILYKDSEYTSIDLEKTIYEVDKARKEILLKL